MRNGKVKRRYRVNGETGKLELGSWHMPMPRSRLARIVIGSALIAGGVLGFMPVVGFWMLPLGFIVLSHDLPVVRRQRRRLAVWWSRRRNPKEEPVPAEKKPDAGAAPIAQKEDSF